MRQLIPITAVLVLLFGPWAFARDTGKPDQPASTKAGPEGSRPRPRPDRARTEEQELDRQRMRERFQNMSEEERQEFRRRMRERFQNMSEEERAAWRARMSRPGFGRLSAAEQLKAIKAIQDQLIRLKEAVESLNKVDFSKFREMSEADRAEMRKELTETYRARQQALTAIREQLARLEGPRPAPTALAGPSARELTEIRDIAQREKAEQTVKRLNALLERQRVRPPMRFPGSGRGGGPAGPAPERGGQGRRGQRGQRGQARPPRPGAGSQR